VTEFQVAVSETFLFASLFVTEGARLLRVYRSTAVRYTDTLMSPVRVLIEAGCSSEGLTRVTEDDRMFGGAACCGTYKLWDVCPGGYIAHDCRAAVAPAMRKGEEEDVRQPVPA